MQELHRRPVAAAGRGGAVSSGARGGTATRGYHRAGMADAPVHTNRLADETSPYLLQHAHNPVDWWPWGPDALTRAQLLDRPVFLSIGYAACHWCHVMERESFEDEQTADYLNANFIAIKVDREERPDLDQIYMTAVQALTGQGGWPMSLFLTPQGRPFFGGTYFPDEPRHGMPSFRQVLEGVAQAWRQDRPGVEQAGSQVVEALLRGTTQAADPAAGLPDAATLDTATREIEQQFDARNGGWGRAPKFPQPMTIEYLLRRHVATGDERPLAIARRSLDAMQDGGIHDQLGGGFHRYSTTADWLVPHFEQMLYDNGQLARVYVHAWQLTSDPAYRATAEGVLDYLLRELATADGGFAASQDADTEGEEGGTFVWTAAESALRSPRRRRRRRATLRRRVRRHRRRELGRDDDPVAPPGRRDARGAVRTAARGGRATPGCGEGRAPRSPCHAAPTRSRRQGARGLERPGDRRARGCRPATCGDG